MSKELEYFRFFFFCDFLSQFHFSFFFLALSLFFSLSSFSVTLFCFCLQRTVADAVIDSNSNGPSDTSPSDPSHDANDKQLTKEEKVEANICNKISTVNDVSAKTSASTAGVELSLPLTTTTTTIANDCLQALTSGVLSSGRCGTIFFFFFLVKHIIFYDGKTHQPKSSTTFSSSIFFSSSANSDILMNKENPSLDFERYDLGMESETRGKLFNLCLWFLCFLAAKKLFCLSIFFAKFFFFFCKFQFLTFFSDIFFPFSHNSLSLLLSLLF